MFSASSGGEMKKKKKSQGLLDLEITSVHGSNGASSKLSSTIPSKQFTSSTIPSKQFTQPILAPLKAYKTHQNQLPSLGQLHINISPNSNTAAPAAASSLSSSEENTHSFIQNTWATFSNLGDSHRNQLLKGLLSRSSSQQIEFICTCLNIKSLDNGTPGNPIPTKVFPETVLGKYLVNARRKPENYHIKTDTVSDVKKVRAEESFKDAMKRAFATSESDFTTSAEANSYLNSNTYVKLMNSNMDPEALSKQLSVASPEGIRFLTLFLSKQCTKFQKVLKAISEISRQPELEKSAQRLFQVMLDVTDAAYGTIYFSPTSGGPVKVLHSNWPNSRNTLNEDQIFGSDVVFKGDMVNVYNFGASDLYKPTQSSHYQQVDPICVLSAPFFGDGMRVTGMMELIGKNNGSPVFTVEDEFILQALTSIGTIIFNQLNIKQSVNKKNDNLKAFVATTSAMPIAKVEMGDMVKVVMDTARELVNADRCTLFLYDEETDELWSKLAHGSEQIRIPSDRGLAGHVFQTGEVFNTKNAYAEPLFNQIVDQKSGYRTSSILSVPLINHENEIVGVIQAINKLSGDFSFNDDDVIQLQSFAAVATTTLEKSNQIFDLTELVGEQRLALNYHRFMLQSMNDVTITIGADSRAQIIENAHLIGFKDRIDLMRATSFEHWLGRQNYRLADLISRAKSTDKPVFANYFVFYTPDQTPIPIKFYVRRLTSSDRQSTPEAKTIPASPNSPAVVAAVKGATGPAAVVSGGGGGLGAGLMAPSQTTSSRVNLKHPGSGKKARSSILGSKKSFKTSAHFKSLDSVAPNAPPYGLLLVISPIPQNRFLMEQLSCQIEPTALHDLLEDPAKLEGEHQPVTICIVDIRRFSAISKHLPPNKINLLLNRYYEMLTNTANQFQAVVTETKGPFATIAVGVPFPASNDANRALDCALAIRKNLEELNRKTEEYGLPTILLSIGVASGMGICGGIGAAKLRKYEVIGHPIEDAVEMQAIAKTYGAAVLVDANTKDLIKDEYHIREVDVINHGDHVGMRLIEIMASVNDKPNHDMMTTIISYELGLAEYKSKNYQAAIMHFKKSQALTDDYPSKFMIERCRGLIDGRLHVPEEDWDGRWDLKI